MEGIMKVATNLALTYKAQGGEGLSLSKLRPKGTLIKSSNHISDGIIPFMKLFNSVTDAISQGGSRKGALLMALDIEHKDAIEFMTIKEKENEINKANLSVEIYDDFMNDVINGVTEKTIIREYDSGKVKYKINPVELYQTLVRQSWKSAEPGVLFMNRFKNYNLMQYVDDYEIEAPNACFTGDMKLLTKDGYKTFEELENTEPLIYDKNGELSKGKVWSSGEKETIKLKIKCFEDPKNKYTIEYITCTPDHIFSCISDDGYTLKQYKAEDLLGKQLNTYRPFEKKVVIDITSNGIQKVYDFIEPNTHWGIVNGCIVHNCGEQPLPKNASCNLSSINLSEYVVNPFKKDSHIDYTQLEQDIKTYITAMDEILDENMDNHPLKEQKKQIKRWRNIGLGVMGYADMLIKLGMKYGSENALNFTDGLFDFIFTVAFKQSNQLAKKKGPFPKYTNDVLKADIIKIHNLDVKLYQKNGLRNASLLSIAPTGSISTMFGISGGIEPIFALSYTRKTESLHGNKEQTYEVFSKIVNEYFDANNVPENERNLDNLPDYFVTAYNIHWKDRVKTQAIIQKHVDTAISSTINLPQNKTIKDMKDL